jgi:PLP dependent protein
VAVSKLHPASSILALHSPSSIPSPFSLPSSAPEPLVHFGENYLQELQQKASLLPKSIQWHFIGGLQTNKCKPLAESIENLWCVSSIDSAKKADQLEKGRAALAEKRRKEDGADLGNLRVHVQVNTSGEENKSGVEPRKEAVNLCKHIREACPHLQLIGLMTIGAIARSQATTPENENEDFVRLKEIRDTIVKELGLTNGELELSMGMSSDFEGAIAMGSDEVRIGSTLFGERPPKSEAKVLEEVKEEKG